jgi:hypothetical protein
VYNHGSVKAWKKFDKGCTVYRYRMEGTIDAPPDIFYQLYTDLPHWKRWDENVDHIEVLGKDESGKVESVYWSVKYPYPFSYRDYVFKRYSSFLEDEGVYVIYQKTTDQIPMKEKPKIVRVDHYQSMVCLKKTEDGKTHIIIDSVDDPKMTLPNWVFNWLTTHGMKKFLATLEKEAQSYTRSPDHPPPNSTKTVHHPKVTHIPAGPLTAQSAVPTPEPSTPVTSEKPQTPSSPPPSPIDPSEKPQIIPAQIPIVYISPETPQPSSTPPSNAQVPPEKPQPIPAPNNHAAVPMVSVNQATH